MTDKNLKQMLAVFLAVLMLRPFPMSAAPSAAVLGSISSYGSVTVGDLASPAENTLFTGDLVNTHAGTAVIQYKEGTRVLLGRDSSAQFTTDEVQLQAGQMTFRSASDQRPVFHASSLRLESAPSSSANVILNDRKATVSVTEGAVRVVDPTGAPLASIQAGEARLFAMAAPSASAAPAAAPQANVPDHTHTVWLLALGAAAVGTSLGIAALVRANNANDSADAVAATNADLLAQIAALETTINTAQDEINTLQGQIDALNSSGTAQQEQIAALQAQIAALQSGIDQSQAQIDDLLAQIEDLERRINEASPAIP